MKPLSEFDGEHIVGVHAAPRFQGLSGDRPRLWMTPVDGLCELGKDDLFGGAFAEDDEASEIEFWVGTNGLADKIGRPFVVFRHTDAVDDGGTRVRAQAQVPNLAGI